jgi:hypothetical protein
MGLETPTYIGDLNASNPAATDVKSQGDDHLRNIKSALLKSFPGFAGAVICAGTNGGSANAYTLTPTTALVGYVANMVAIFSPAAQNTGASTLNISGLGTKNIKTVDGSALTSADLVVGYWYAAVYDGTEFRLIATTKRYIDGLAFSTALPNQPGNADRYLSTDGTNAAWREFSATAAQVRAGASVITALTPVTLTDAATVAVDLSTGINFVVTLGGNRTLGNPTNTKDGQTGRIRVVQDGTGSRTLSFAANWKRQGGAPTLSTAAGAIDFIDYEVVSSTYIRYEFCRSPG